MEDARRAILAKVAAGTMTPTEAATRLDEVERGQTQIAPSQPAASAATDIRGVRVKSDYGRVIVLGTPPWTRPSPKDRTSPGTRMASS